MCTEKKIKTSERKSGISNASSFDMYGYDQKKTKKETQMFLHVIALKIKLLKTKMMTLISPQLHAIVLLGRGAATGHIKQMVHETESPKNKGNFFVCFFFFQNSISL